MKNLLYTLAFIGGVILLIWLSISPNSSSPVSSYDDTDCQEQVSDLEDKVDRLQSALDEANDQIRDANYNAWEDYDTMGETLDNLHEVYE